MVFKVKKRWPEFIKFKKEMANYQVRFFGGGEERELRGF
jgi:hypothetical protein